jgi:hypothetical protein
MIAGVCICNVLDRVVAMLILPLIDGGFSWASIHSAASPIITFGWVMRDALRKPKL